MPIPLHSFPSIKLPAVAAELHASLHEDTVAVRLVFQQLAIGVVQFRFVMPPASANTDVERSGQLVFDKALKLETVAFAARSQSRRA